MPSELLGQLRPGLVHIDDSCVAKYGPILRKGQIHPQSTLEARCVCKAEPLLCCHVWAKWLLAEPKDPEIKIFPENCYAVFLQNLRDDLSAIGVPRSEANQVASHAFRHGAAMDIHDQEGLAAARERGQWKGSSVRSYVPTSAIESKFLADALCTASEEEAEAEAEAWFPRLTVQSKFYPTSHYTHWTIGGWRHLFEITWLNAIGCNKEEV